MDLVARLLDAAADEGTHLERAPDAIRGDIRALERLDTAARDHVDILDLGQLPDQPLGESVGDEAQGVTGRQVVEIHHGQLAGVVRACRSG